MQNAFLLRSLNLAITVIESLLTEEDDQQGRESIERCKDSKVLTPADLGDQLACNQRSQIWTHQEGEGP
jgi:hypothetical protein